MSSDQFKHIQSIRKDFRDGSKRLKISSQNAIRTLADDLYNKHTHFIFELIQNAEDNTYADQNTYPPYISFRLTKTDPTDSVGSDGALIIQNNEVGFSADNVDTICTVGETTKEKGHGYIGEKGIGFKSVFRVTNNPYIFSNGYRFCLPEVDEGTGLGYIVPQWVKKIPEGLDLFETHIILPLTKKDFGYKEIEGMLQDIEPEVILFLSTLQEIRIKTDTGDDFTILKDDSKMPEVQIIVEGKKQVVVEGKKQTIDFSNSDDFLVCTERYDRPADVYHEKRDGIESRDVTIGFPLDEKSTAVGKIFAYLPVRSGTGFPFLINADFILPSSREDIHDVPWNRSWLMECVADLIAGQLLPFLKKRERLTVGFLEKLTSKLNNLAENEDDLFYPVFSRLRETFMNEKMLPAHDKTFVSARDAKLADSEGLIGLLDSNQLSLLFKRSEVTKWLLSDISARRTQSLWKYLRNELGIDEVDPEMFARRIDESFLKQQSDNWFIDFYRFLFVGDRPPKSLWTVPSNILQKPGILLSKPILRLQDNSLVNPNESNVYLSKGTDSETASGLIKSEISQNEDAHKFLKELGVPEWDLVAEVIAHILPKYRDNRSVISGVQYNRDFSKIVRAYATDSQKKKDMLREALLKTPFVLDEKSNPDHPIYFKPNQLIFGSSGNLWKDNCTGDYSCAFVGKEICEFLRTLDIPQWDIVEEVIKTIIPKYKQQFLKVPTEMHKSDFKKITHAYETCDQYGKEQLKTELQAAQFILAENPETDFPIYLKPNHLYFGSDALRMYFGSCSLVSWIECWNDVKENWAGTGYGVNEYLADIWCDFVDSSRQRPMAGAFVNLDEYPDSARKLFEDLDIGDTVRIHRKSKDNQGRVNIIDKHSNHRRGLHGFDPDIKVDGLEFVIESVTPEKSAFIWNEIALPNADCIRGTVEKSTRQDFSNSSFEEVISPYFGRLLIDNAWLPDSDGNMHKPSDITLDDLPDSFEKNEQLAKQLGMRISKSRIVKEFASKLDIPPDILYGVVNATPETVQQIESLLRPATFPVASVPNPERRKKVILAELKDAPNQKYVEKVRSVRATRGMIDPKTWLSIQYRNVDGQVICQICQEEMPFKYRGENYYFDAVEMLRGYFTKEYEAQFLALCPECSPKYRTFVKQEPEVMDALRKQLMDSGDVGDFEVPLKLGDTNANLRFVERHWRDIKAILSFYEQQSEQSVETVELDELQPKQAIETHEPDKKELEPEQVPSSQPVKKKESWNADSILHQFFEQPVRFVTYTGMKDLSQVKTGQHDVTGVDAEGSKITLTKSEILFAFPKEKLSALKSHVNIRRPLKNEGLQPIDTYSNRFQVADKLLRQVKENKFTVKVVTRAGYVLNGWVQHFDKYVLYMRVAEKVVIVYRHGLYGFTIEEE